MGCALGRRMEGKTTIKWIDEAGYCKIIFVFDDIIYLLFRKQIWGGTTIYGVPKNIKANINVDLARELWNKLTKLQNFKLMEITHE